MTAPKHKLAAILLVRIYEFVGGIGDLEQIPVDFTHSPHA